MFPGPTELRLIGCSIELTLDPKFQIKYIDTKNQLADVPTKGNFTRDEWNHLLCLINISHFSSTVCSDTMAKRSQQESLEERVTAKSRRMKASDYFYHEQFMESFSSTNYSKLDDDRAWSSQEWKTEATTYNRSGMT